jgi:hypothetical protein
MNKSYLNYTLFLAIVVIFCLAAYLYINDANTQFKEHFYQDTDREAKRAAREAKRAEGAAAREAKRAEGAAAREAKRAEGSAAREAKRAEGAKPGFTLSQNVSFYQDPDKTISLIIDGKTHRLDYDISNLDIETHAVDPIIAQCGTSSDCNGIFCDTNSEGKCVSISDRFEFKIIKVKIDTTESYVMLQPIGQPVHGTPEGIKHLEIQVLSDNLNNSDVSIDYDNINLNDEQIKLKLPDRCSDGSKCISTIIIMALFRKDEPANIPGIPSPSVAASICNSIDNIENDSEFIKCIQNNCRLDSNDQNLFNCTNNSDLPPTTTIVNIVVAGQSASNIDINMNSHSVHLRDAMITLAEGGGKINLYTLKNYQKMFIFVTNNSTKMTMDNLQNVIISLNSPDPQVTSIFSVNVTNNNTDDINMYLIVKGTPASNTPQTDNGLQCSGLSEVCINNLCNFNTGSGWIDDGTNMNFMAHGSCNRNDACTEENIRLYCPDEWTRPTSSATSSYNYTSSATSDQGPSSTYTSSASSDQGPSSTYTYTSTASSDQGPSYNYTSSASSDQGANGQGQGFDANGQGQGVNGQGVNGQGQGVNGQGVNGQGQGQGFDVNGQGQGVNGQGVNGQGQDISGVEASAGSPL